MNEQEWIKAMKAQSDAYKIMGWITFFGFICIVIAIWYIPIPFWRWICYAIFMFFIAILISIGNTKRKKDMQEIMDKMNDDNPHYIGGRAE